MPTPFTLDRSIWNCHLLFLLCWALVALIGTAFRRLRRISTRQQILKGKGQRPNASASEIVNCHDQLVASWHLAPDNPDTKVPSLWLLAVSRHHRAQLRLMAHRGRSSRPGVTTRNWPTSSTASTKPTPAPQRPGRNNSTAPCSPGLNLRPCPTPTPLSMPSRRALSSTGLSILALKIYHTREEAERTDAPPGHASRNRDRLAILENQRADLAGCLMPLWRENPRRSPPIQALSPVENVQRSCSQPGHLPQFPRPTPNLSPLEPNRYFLIGTSPLTSHGVMRIKGA